jgi:ATP-dependent Clp protease protease subunit
VIKIAKVNIKGPIISNDDQWIYDWFEIEATSPKSVEKQIEKANGEALEVYINSPGGYVDAGSEIYTTLKEYTADVVVKIVGVAASAASVIAMAGKKVVISPTAQIMIHNVSSIVWGDYRAMQHEAEVIKNYNSSIANAYILKTGLSKDELLELMDDETWLTAQQAVEKKFADEVMFDDGTQPKLVASLRSSQMLPPEVIDKVRNELANRNKPETPSVVEPEPDPLTNKTEQTPEAERTPRVSLSLLQKKLNLRRSVL